MYDAVVKRLETLGYSATESDGAAIQFALDRAEQWIKNDTSQPEVPDGLKFVWVDMAAGLFLLDLKAAGRFTVPAEFTAPVKSKSMGDTSVSFAVNNALSPEEQFGEILNNMVNPSPGQLAAFRRFRW